MATVIDFGTPARTAEATVTLEIDGKSVTVPAGTSVMRAASEAGVAVPKLCATDSLEPFGSCRLCMVEIQGRRGTPASCTTPVEEGMRVTTQNDRLAKLRRGVMELYISDHPLDCLTCAANGDCELQDMAGAVGLREVRYGYDGENHIHQAKDVSNPYFAFDPSKCIACSRCVRACEEVQGTFALTIGGRGFDSHVSAGMDEDFLDSECVSCGACVQACPTATLVEKSVLAHGQPDRSVVTTCAYCGVGCSFKAELQGNRVVRMTPHKDGKANHGHSCVKGRFAWGYATHKDRVTQPMVRASIHEPWRVVSWDEAIAHAAEGLQRVQATYGRGSIGGITSSRCTNEEVFVIQKMIRAAFGNNNVDTCARVCHSPTGYGLGTAFGTSAGTQDFDSVDESDVILVIGANPTDGHPVFASRMKRRLREGAKLIVVDPRQIDLVRMPHVAANHHLQLRPGTNVAVMNALAHVIATEGLIDEGYVAETLQRRRVRGLAQLHRAAGKRAGSCGGHDRRAGGAGARGSPALRHRRPGGDLLRPGRHRAQPGLDHRHGHGQPRHGHRQHRSARRGREPAARPEQCPGCLRHGLVPARALGLSPRRRRSDPRTVRGRLGPAGRGRARPAHPQHARLRRSTAPSRACSSRARTSPSPTPTRSMSRRPWPPWNAW